MKNDPTTEHQKQLRNRVRAAAKAQAYSLLASLHEAPDKPVRARARVGDIEAHIAIGAKGSIEEAAPAETPAGLFFSPIEAAVVEALKNATGGYLLGKLIAKRLNQPYGADLKFVLRNLRARQVLAHKKEGYCLAGAASKA